MKPVLHNPAFLKACILFHNSFFHPIHCLPTQNNLRVPAKGETVCPNSDFFGKPQLPEKHNRWNLSCSHRKSSQMNVYWSMFQNSCRLHHPIYIYTHICHICCPVFGSTGYSFSPTPALQKYNAVFHCILLYGQISSAMLQEYNN